MSDAVHPAKVEAWVIETRLRAKPQLPPETLILLCGDGVSDNPKDAEKVLNQFIADGCSICFDDPQTLRRRLIWTIRPALPEELASAEECQEN